MRAGRAHGATRAAGPDRKREDERHESTEAAADSAGLSLTRYLTPGR